MLQSTSIVGNAPLTGRFLFVFAPMLSLLGWAGLVAAWLAPNHYPPWTSFHGEAVAFAALCCLLAARACRPVPVHGGSTIWAVLLLLILLISAQVAAGQIAYSGDALVSALFVVGAGGAFWLGQEAESEVTDEALHWLSIAFAAGAGANVFIGLLQWLHMEQTLGIFAADRGPDMRVYGNLGQPNHLATLCLMGIAGVLWLSSRARIRRWHFVLLVSWLSFGLLLTESRAGLLGAVAVGLLLVWGDRRLPGARTFVSAWWGALAVGHVLIPRISDLLFLNPARREGLGDDNQRFVMWRQAVSAIQDAPWLGHGWRQTMRALKQAASDVPGRLPTDYAHNLVLDMLVWVGIPCGVLLTGFGTFWLLRACRRIADSKQLLLMTATLPVLVHSLFEFPFAYAYFLFPAAWLLGALAGAQSPEGRVRRPSWGRPSMALLLCVFASVSVVVGSEYLEAEEDYRVMRFELRRVGQLPVGYQAPKLVMLDQLGELLQMGRVQAGPGMSHQILERLRLVSETNGWATLDLTYAVALGFNGQSEEASRGLAQIERVYGKESAHQAYAMFRAYQAARPGLEKVHAP
jgi:O-antigen ligase